MKALFPDFGFAYIDAEFTPNNRSASGLVSLAIHSERGDLYLVNSGADREAFCANIFCRDNIWSKLPLLGDGSLDTTHPNVVHYGAIRQAVSNYFEAATDGASYRRKIGVVADHGTQDMQRIHDLFGNDWSTMPKWIPQRPFQDLATLEDLAGVEKGLLPGGAPLPEKGPGAHHALEDAQWDRRVHEFLLERSAAVRIACGLELVDPASTSPRLT
jgi:hypothetical protein